MSDGRGCQLSRLLVDLAVRDIEFSISHRPRSGYRLRLGPADEPVAGVADVGSIQDATEWLASEARRRFPEAYLQTQIAEFRRQAVRGRPGVIHADSQTPPIEVSQESTESGRLAGH